MAIVVIEDDQDIRELIEYSLKLNNKVALGFDSGESFFNENLNNFEVDLILLDIMLPKDDGITILKKIRSNSEYRNTPVIMLTAKDSEIDKVKALDLGSDDYVVKPFGVMELISRINAILRRTRQTNILKFREITIDIDKYIVKVNEKVISLTNKEFDLLLYLLNNIDIVISREKLLEEVWGFDYEGESRTLDIHISNLRKNLLSSAKYLQTVRGIGYKIGDLDD